CGRCDACVEIAEARDIDVLEIDAATHTGIDNIREVIISGLSIRPARNRYKIFIIDEVHQLSAPSFNALLKSIEEPPPHVVFMMATTELEKIPETVLSRSQVYEFRTIGTKAIAGQLRLIVDKEQITVGEESLQLIARDAEGSMRDAQSKLDQVIAFTGKAITGEDVATVLGLVGRDLLLDGIQAVADEDATAAFTLAGRAVEMGYDLRAVCRELSRVVRDLLVLAVDPSRISDPEIAGEGERERLTALAARFSREDLLRAFDLLTRTEAEIRSAAQPRYHLEMALLRWIYLRKLVPIEELIANGSAGVEAGSSRTPPVPKAAPAIPPPARSSTSSVASGSTRPSPPVERAEAAAGVISGVSRTRTSQSAGVGLKDALLAEIRTSKAVFYNTVVAQAQKVEVAAGRVTFSFSPAQRAIRDVFEKDRSWLESIAQRLAGQTIVVAAVQVEAATPEKDVDEGSATTVTDRKSALREQALADAGVQAMLDVFPAEIRDEEEM
ncbi:MAG: DNA polymerase III subunit gamma/tau, partial [Acidobacteria bacterium]